MMISSAFNTPADWLRAGGAFDTIDDFAAHHHGFAPVLVFVDPTGAFDNDTECVNGSRGNAADHLTKDVVPFVVSNFGVSADRANWGVAGWSMGGTCAVDVTVMHPEMFSAFVDIAGDRSPNVGTKEQTIARLFGGNSAAWAAFDPATVIARHGHYTGVSGWFDVPESSGPHNVAQEAIPTLGAPSADPAANPEGQDAAANSLCDVATANGITCAVVTQPGKHDWPFAAQAFAASLPWLASTLGTPGTEPVPAAPARRRGASMQGRYLFEAEFTADPPVTNPTYWRWQWYGSLLWRRSLARRATPGRGSRVPTSHRKRPARHRVEFLVPAVRGVRAAAPELNRRVSWGRSRRRPSPAWARPVWWSTRNRGHSPRRSGGRGDLGSNRAVGLVTAPTVGCPRRAARWWRTAQDSRPG